MKKLHLIIALFLCFLCNTFVSQAQENIPIDKREFKIEDKDNFKDAWDAVKAGDDLFELGPEYYRDAVVHYLEANEYNPDNAVLNYKIGVCYLWSRHREKAIPYLEKVAELDHEIIFDLEYMLGVAYQFDMQFETAIGHFETYRNSLTVSELKFEQERIEKHISECRVGIELVANPVNVFIDNVGSVINSDYPDYAPLISADESMMIFTSRRPNTTGNEIDPTDNLYYEDIYISYREGGEWQPPQQFRGHINTSGHDATVGISPDGHKFFIYNGQKGNGDLFVCQARGNEWSKPEALSKEINTKFHEPSASFAPDGRTMYFVSNKEDDNFGFHDIYKATLDEDGEWGNPQNLGPVINTPYEEESVFIHPDGRTLYFSSQGHNSMGGYDIFKSVMDENGNWSEPENIGYPINTPNHDLFFVLAGNGKRGYFSSSKEGGYGFQDIYVINFITEKPLIQSNEDNLLASITQPMREQVIEREIYDESTRLTILKGLVYDSITKVPLQAKIEIVDNSTGTVIGTFETNSETGRFLVPLPSGKNYGIAVKSDGYLFHSENFDIPATQGYQEIYKEVPLLKIEPGARIVLRNVFFDTAKYNLRDESKTELNRLIELLNQYPQMRIEISGHTDNRASLEYNITLSKNRAKSVVNYLIEYGIDASRLEYEGYAYNQPIATNDTPEGRQLNRRVEFKILSN